VLRKNSFAKESKNSARYRSENIFVTDQMSSSDDNAAKVL